MRVKIGKQAQLKQWKSHLEELIDYIANYLESIDQPTSFWGEYEKLEEEFLTNNTSDPKAYQELIKKTYKLAATYNIPISESVKLQP